MNPFAVTFKSNVLHAQAYGAWLFIHVHEWAVLIGHRCPWGLRLVWTRPLPSLRFVRFTR